MMVAFAIASLFGASGLCIFFAMLLANRMGEM